MAGIYMFRTLVVRGLWQVSATTKPNNELNNFQPEASTYCRQWNASPQTCDTAVPAPRPSGKGAIPMATPENLLTTKEFSQRSGKPMSTVQKWLRSGKLSGTKIGTRWYISPSELSELTTDEGGSAPAAGENSTAAPEAKTEGEKASAGASYSVAEFSALTYLTETGVLRWLKSGRLMGERAGDGSWTVKAESLDLPQLRHLIR